MQKIARAVLYFVAVCALLMQRFYHVRSATACDLISCPARLHSLADCSCISQLKFMRAVAAKEEFEEGGLATFVLLNAAAALFDAGPLVFDES